MATSFEQPASSDKLSADVSAEPVRTRRYQPRHADAANDSSADVSGEVVSQKGRSVKSIIGMFDQPGFHEPLTQSRSNPSFAASPQQMTIDDAQRNGFAAGKEQLNMERQTDRQPRNATQVVHIAKFVQIETPGKQSPPQYSDAQTSPIQLSPIEHGGLIAKAGTFQGVPRPKLAIITSSSSSHLSNEVFTPSENIETPVFESEPLRVSSYNSGAHTHYSDGTASIATHNSHIPGHQYSQYYNDDTQVCCISPSSH